MLRRFFSVSVLWAIFCAILYDLSYPPAALWPMSLPAYALLSWLVFEENHTRKEYFKLFFFFTLATNVFGLYWIPHTLIEFSEFPVVVAWFVGGLGFLAMSVMSAATGAIFVPVVKKWSKTIPAKFALVFVFWMLWDFLDYRFFPWSPVQSFGSQPQLLASAAVFGTLGWSALFYLLIAGIHLLKKQSFAKRVGIWSAACVAVLTVGAFLGNEQIKILKAKYSVRQKVALLQGNVGNFEKRLQGRNNESPTNENVLRIYRDLVERLALKQKYSGKTEEYFAFWPETAFPGFPLNDSSLSELLSSWAKLTNSYHLIGAYEERGTPDPGTGKTKTFQYNVVAAYNSHGEFKGHYQKVQRMPFGEYVPGDEYYPWIYERFKFLNQFGKGERYVPLAHDDPKGPIFLPFICFEVLKEGFVKDAVAQARAEYPGRDLIIVNPTNDSWFGEGAELFLHSHLARWQAAREQIPFVRPTNTGISMVIAPWGEILARGRVGIEDLIVTDLPLTQKP